MATYTPPGVFVVESSEALYSSSAVSPSSVGIFGEAADTLHYEEIIAIPPDTPGSPSVQEPSGLLRFPNVDNVSVTLVENNEPLAVSTDYELIETIDGDNTWVAIQRVKESNLLQGTGGSVIVSYDYIPASFNDTLRFTNPVDVAMFYGEAFDNQGNVNSPLTLAAQLAFDNGAISVITVATKGGSTQDYRDALDQINKAKDIAILTTTSGSADLLGAISLAVNKASNQELERRAIVGLDGTGVPVSTESLIQSARQINNKRVALIAPTVAKITVRSVNQTVSVGGQFLAAAIAGEAVALGVQEPLTRKTVFGFSSVPDSYDTTTKNSLAANGVMVIEETLQGVIRIRHGVTTDISSKNNSEWSVVGVTDYIVSSARSMLDTASFVGSAITSATIPSLLGMMTGFLTSAIADNIIGDYDQLAIIQRPSEPDVIDIRFAVGFMFPLNRIYVTMSSSASTGSTTTTIA